MKFNVGNFLKGIEPYRIDPNEEKPDQSGLFLIFKYVLRGYPLNEMDFDSFTYSDIKKVYEAVEDSPIKFDEEEETYTLDPENPLTQTIQMNSIIYNFIHTKDVHYFDEDEYFNKIYNQRRNLYENRRL